MAPKYPKYTKRMLQKPSAPNTADAPKNVWDTTQQNANISSSSACPSCKLFFPIGSSLSNRTSYQIQRLRVMAPTWHLYAFSRKNRGGVFNRVLRKSHTPYADPGIKICNSLPLSRRTTHPYPQAAPPLLFPRSARSSRRSGRSCKRGCVYVLTRLRIDPKLPKM